MRIVSNQEMQQIDQTAIDELGMSSLILMENAGLEATRIISQVIANENYRGEVLVFCGKGKNGGDGLVVARRLIGCGHRVRVFLMHSEAEYTEESRINLNILSKMKAKLVTVESSRVVEDYFLSVAGPFLIIDALLGTGLIRPLEGHYYDIAETINKYAGTVIALDIPSGVNGNSGEVLGAAIQADVTISFGFPKLGHFLTPRASAGASRRGKLFHVDLNFPQVWSKQGSTFLLTHQNTAKLLQQRDRFGHKNSFGHCLLIGGTPGRIGAIVMASQSALKMGTGLVTVASFEESFPTLEYKLPSEIMNFKITKVRDQFMVPEPGLNHFSSIVIGPGLGVSIQSKQLLEQLLEKFKGPLVIDADALNVIAEYQLHDLLALRNGPTVLTPHPGEMARLMGLSKDEVINNPLAITKLAYERTSAVVVLKGATTIIQSRNNWINHYPNDGMATAGSGDVLAGMIGGLLGQRMDETEAARLGVYLHSLAGKYAVETCGHRSMTALDIVENIKYGFKSLREYQEITVHEPCIEIV